MSYLPLSVLKNLIDLHVQWEKYCDHSSAFNFEWIFFILADNKDNYKSLYEFEFRQLPLPLWS